MVTHLGQFKADIEEVVDNGTAQVSWDNTVDNGAIRCIGVDDTTGFTIDLHSTTGDLASNLVVATEYCVKVNAAVDTGDSVDIVVWDGDSSSSQTVTSTDLEDYTFDITVASGSTPYITLANLATDEILWMSRYTVREITGTTPDEDMEKMPMDGTPDLGCYEYQS